jgi:hypothetical protein
MGNIGGAISSAVVLGFIVVLGLTQLTLQILALVSLFRTPQERLVTGRRWVWLLVIAVGVVGAVVYFAAARRPALADDPLGTTGEGQSPDTKAHRAADLLYGDPADRKDRGEGR